MHLILKKWMRNPMYNDKTKEILNCKKNTKVYFHEKRHAKQDKDGYLLLLQIIHEYLVMISYVVAILLFMNTLIFQTSFPYKIMFWILLITCFPILYLELDAMIVAEYDYHKYKKRRK